MTTKERRYDLDWIRVLVFDLLIFYHVGMFFVPWEWHINNSVTTEGLIYPMVFVNQWRLAILFVISGMGTRFALAHRNGAQFLLERAKRLVIPLIFGMIIIVPPQVYLERLTQGVDFSSYLDFYPHYFEGIYPEGNFSWHHLWFLPYLFFYTLLLSPVFLYLRKEKASSFFRIFERWLDRFPLSIYGLIIPLGIVHYALAYDFPTTHAFVGDWYTLSIYVLFFFYGFLLISVKDSFFKAIEKIKFWCLLIGILSFASLVYLWENDIDFMGGYSFLKMINIWSWILAIFAYASKYLNRNSQLLRYRNRAVYPYYILHQTITIIIAYPLIHSNYSIACKFLILVVGTFVITGLIYEFVIRRIPYLGIFFGLKKV